MSFQRIGLHLTDRCQLDCQHCLRDPEHKPSDLPLDIIAHVLDQAVGFYKIKHVSLTGGEPSLHPEFAAVLDAIAVRGCQWDMVTNGKRFAAVLALLDQQPARRASFRSMSLSLDGVDEATHDHIRGKDSYRDVMTAATLCQVRGIRFGIQMAVHAGNQAQIEQMGLLASQLGAAHVSFAMTQPTGTVHDTALFLPASAWRAVQDRIERLSETLKLPVIMPEGYYRERPFGDCGPFRGETLHVDVRGWLTLCCMHSGIPSDGRKTDVAGDLHEVSLLEAHRNLLSIIHEAQVEKLAAIESKKLDEWDQFPCNYCLRTFGKVHWTRDGAKGPEAQRERWRGAWALEAKTAHRPEKVRTLRVID